MTTATITDWPAELERLAREAEPEAWEKADQLFAEYAAEHQRQSDGYVFECRRWGDFLSVFIERKGNGEPDWWDGVKVNKVSQSLNIGIVKAIRFVEGHCFDRRGSLGYGYSMPADKEEHGAVIGGTGFGHYAPHEGYHYEVQPNFPYLPKSRPLIVIAKEKDKDRFYGSDSYEIRHRTENFPRPAQDDQIVFEGIRTTIYVPAGKGRGVYDAILAEIAKNAPPVELPR